MLNIVRCSNPFGGGNIDDMQNFMQNFGKVFGKMAESNLKQNSLKLFLNFLEIKNDEKYELNFLEIFIFSILSELSSGFSANLEGISEGMAEMQKMLTSSFYKNFLEKIIISKKEKSKKDFLGLIQSAYEDENIKMTLGNLYKYLNSLEKKCTDSIKTPNLTIENFLSKFESEEETTQKIKNYYVNKSSKELITDIENFVKANKKAIKETDKNSCTGGCC